MVGVVDSADSLFSLLYVVLLQYSFVQHFPISLELTEPTLFSLGSSPRSIT
ncbi:hypothetical protein PGB90_002099 [Kerria lacca]